MEKRLIWYGLLLKADGKKKITWLVILALVVLVLIFHGIRIPDAENMVVGIGGVGDDCAAEVVDTLRSMDSVFEFEIYSDTDQLYEDVTSGTVECGFIFCAGFEEKILDGKPEGTVTCLSTPYASKAEVAKETFFSAFFRVYSDEILTDVSAEIFAEEDEERPEELLTKSHAYAEGSSVFDIEEVFVETMAAEEEGAQESTLPEQGIVGLVVLLVTFLAAGRFYEGRSRGLRHFLNRRDRAEFLFLSELAAATPVLIAGLILIMVLQVQRSLPGEILRFVLMGLLAAGWSLVIVSLLRSETAVVSCVAILVLAHLALFPIFWDVSQYVPAVEYIRYCSPMVVLYL